MLGIDPGLTRCGIGVVEGSVGRPLTLVDVDVRAHARRPARSPSGWSRIERGIDAWLDEHRPDAVAVERVFARSDSSTIMGTAQASGIALVAAARRGLPVALHTPSEVKAAVSGSGRADKAQVGRDGRPGSCGSTRRPSRPTPPTRWRWPSPTSGAAAPRPGSTRPSAGSPAARPRRTR